MAQITPLSLGPGSLKNQNCPAYGHIGARGISVACLLLRRRDVRLERALFTLNIRQVPLACP
jgi:hypothetical protein